MPFSKRSMCSGSTIPDCTTCKSCSTFGSALARQAARKSACFWLSPSRQMRSPGRITASSSAVVSLDDTIFPAATLLPAAIRSSRARCSLCQSAMSLVPRSCVGLLHLDMSQYDRSPGLHYLILENYSDDGVEFTLPSRSPRWSESPSAVKKHALGHPKAPADSKRFDVNLVKSTALSNVD